MRHSTWHDSRSRSRSIRRGRRGSRTNFDRRDRDSFALPTRSREPRHSGRHHRSRSPTSNGRSEQPNPFNINAVWVGDSHHYDTQKEYGLKFPHCWKTCQTSHQYRASFQELRQARKIVTQFVSSPADHFPNSILLSCPCQWHQLLLRTFKDSQVFHSGSQLPAQVLSNTLNAFPAWICKKYKWAVASHKYLSSAYVLPKPSRQFQKARPIVDCSHSWALPLGSALAVILLAMAKIAFPFPCIQQTLPPFLPMFDDQIRTYFASLSRPLAGRSKQHRALELQDLVPLARALLEFSVFHVGLATFRQTRGASMGSQWAPVLCSIVALHREHTYRKCLTAPLSDRPQDRTMDLLERCIGLCSSTHPLLNSRLWMVMMHWASTLIHYNKRSLCCNRGTNNFHQPDLHASD